MMRHPPPHSNIAPGFVLWPFLTASDAYDLVELALGESQAKSLATRLESLEQLRQEFGEAVSRLACSWDDTPGGDVEQLVVVDRHRSSLKHAAAGVCRYIDTLASLADARSAQTSAHSAHRRDRPPHSPSLPPPQASDDRLRQLRQTFQLATRRLDELPRTELSPSGQPFIQECAEAMEAFAEWFGEQTPDDVSLLGNAHRVYNALGGLSGVIDWVALHWSVPFSKELDNGVADLVKEADAFDVACVKAFKRPSKRHELRVERKALSDRTYSDLEDRISLISSMAAALGARLRRLAVWAAEGHRPNDRVRGTPDVSSRDGDDSRPDGVYGPRTVVWQGRAHQCDLTKREMAFLEVALGDAEMEIGLLMHPKSGLVAKQRYVSTKQNRDYISKFLSRLNSHLLKADPPLGMTFSLLRDRDFVVRSDPADTSLTSRGRKTSR